MRTEQGKFLDFRDRPYLEKLLDDQRARHVCVACAQSGKTVTYQAKMFHRLLNPRALGFVPTAIYTFPTKEDVIEFSKARAKPMLEASPLLANEIADLDAANVKQGKSGWTIYFRGTKTERAALSIPAGMLLHDELDRSQPDTLQQYSDRTRNSTDPHVYLYSTPTVPGYGISARWEESDQQEWFWDCPYCGEEQTFAPMDKSIKWQDQLDTERRCFTCYHCGVPIKHSAVLRGRWVAQAPENADVAGYHITGIMPALSTAERLCAEYEKAGFPELFVQGHLGLPEVSARGEITEDMIAFGDWANTLKSETATFAGLDQGRKLDFVAGDGKGRIVAVHRFDDWAQVANAMQTLNVQVLVADSQPEPRPLQELVGRFPGRVMLADYSLNALRGEAYFEKDARKPRVRIHRTAALDATATQIIMGAANGDVFPDLPPRERKELVSHITAPKRSLQEDVHGVQRGVWIETGPDHLRHAHLYYTVASTQPRGGAVATKQSGQRRRVA